MKPPDSSLRRRALPGIVAGIAASLLLLFLVAPVVGLVASGGVAGVRGLWGDGELRDSLVLTAFTATSATLLGVVLGTPLAYLLERRRFVGRGVIAAVLDLPLLLPHPVAGIALLLLMGRDSAIGAALGTVGLRVVGSPFGIICAMLFVSAPLFVSGAREAIARVDRRYEAVAQTLGDSPWRALWRVTLPMSGRGILAASVVMWARAVSEFGAIVILVHQPRTVSALSYDRFTLYGLREAIPVAAVLVLMALIPLAFLRTLRSNHDSLVESGK